MKRQVIDIVETFFKSFDSKNWLHMENCLARNLELDYQSFRGNPKYETSSKDYIEQRIKGLEGLDTVHETFDYLITEKDEPGQLNCKCKFEIRRFEKKSKEYFHSFGEYELGIRKNNGEWKIYKIKQVVERNEGNREIHGAFKK